MSKFIRFFVLLVLLSQATMSHAQNLEKSDPGFLLLDIVLYRPLGTVATVVGATAFVGISPLIGLASIPNPHDAFAKTAAILVLAPAAYTFIMPIGDREFPYVTPPTKHKMTVIEKKPVVKEDVQPVTPTSPPSSLEQSSHSVKVL